MLLPITFPKASSPDPRSEAATETANSGADVPKPITVAPIIKGLILKDWARCKHPLTRNSPP